MRQETIKKLQEELPELQELRAFLVEEAGRLNSLEGVEELAARSGLTLKHQPLAYVLLAQLKRRYVRLTGREGGRVDMASLKFPVQPRAAFRGVHQFPEYILVLPVDASSIAS